MPSIFHYTAIHGHFAATEVRPHDTEPDPAPVLADGPEGETPTETLARNSAFDAAMNAYRINQAEAAAKVKPYTFLPLAENGTDRVKIERRTIDLATFEAWQAETDGDKRTAILARGTTGKVLTTKSPLSPTATQVAAMRALVSRESLPALMRAGYLIIPSDRADKAATTNAKGRKLTEDERTDAALDSMFADADATPTDPSIMEAEADAAHDEANADEANTHERLDGSDIAAILNAQDVPARKARK